jgi:hypothetical protein
LNVNRGGVDAARAALGALRSKVSTAATAAALRARKQAAASDLRGQLSAFLGDDPARDFARLDARYPIAFFPVRIETRFDQGSSSLLIRVYPDEILADGHDPTLTPDEQKMGQQFWTEAGTLGAATAWQHLLGVYKPPRAAWIVRATDPTVSTPPVIRAGSWPRPFEAPLLPDRWVAIAYRAGAVVAQAHSLSVVEPLALTVDPNAPSASSVDISAGLGLKLDTEVAWTVDYQRAVAAGMAFPMKIGAAEFASGIDRLLVFGVKGSLGPQESASAVGSLFDAHHYSRGWAFVAQGTPTNDSREAPSGYPPADPNGAASFATERGAWLATADGDGAAWARAFGVPADIVAHVAGADRTEQVAAAAMNRALYPATWGYFLDTMMDPDITASTTAAVREYMVANVRARGPLPAFRVGAVPYGVLPVSSLQRWRASGRGIDLHLLPLLLTARKIWLSQLGAAAHIGRIRAHGSVDPDADLLEIMSMDASARAIRLRKVLGQDAQWNLLGFLGLDWSSWASASRLIAASVLASAGLLAMDAKVLSAVFANDAQRFLHGFVTGQPVSETQLLDPNYVSWIRNASIATVQNESFPLVPDALLYRLLRYAALHQPWAEARAILLSSGMASAADLREHELIGIVEGTQQRPTVWHQLARQVPGVTQSLPLGKFLSPIEAGEAFRALPPALVAFRDALGVLEVLSTAELERLMTETLDLASHRLDAWITSLPNARLNTMREATPTGIYVGAYAWVEHLRASTAPTQRLANGADARVSTGGYIHAPSMTHAAAAAVLRNGFLTHATGAAASSPYAVNLTSSRSRSALFVLDSVRQGQSVGAVFGYQIERGLHEHDAEVLIDPLRNLYPIVANKTEDSGEQAETVAARAVVDGLRLRTAWINGAIPWGSNGIPASGSLRDTLQLLLNQLNDTVDAVADLLLAESVFQLVRGSTPATAATLDAMAQGVRPPEPAVVHPLRGGTDLTHRVAIVLGGAAMALPAGWPAATVRAAAEPRLDAWVGSLLGSPVDVRCRVSYPDPTSADPGHLNTVTVTLDQLGMRPLDVLALVAAAGDGRQASELDRRVVFAACGDDVTKGPATVDYSRDAGWDRVSVRTVPEILELARAINTLLGGAGALAPEHMVLATDAAGVKGSGLAVAEIETRAQNAETSLANALNPLAAAVAAVPAGAAPTAAEAAALRAALRGVANFGPTSGYPIPGAGLPAGQIDPTLLEQASSVLAELTTRKQKAADAHLPALPAPTDPERTAAATAILEAVFGRGFLCVPGYTPPAAANVAAALAASAALIQDQRNAQRWLQRMSRVREPLGRWRYLRLLSGALSSTQPINLEVSQLPVTSSARWGALPFTSESDRAPSRLSLTLERVTDGSPAANEVWYGLLIDEWVELIPNRTETTGLTFHYDDPGAEAAQAVLLAVPPVPDAKAWDQDTVADILLETLDLAGIRAVDSSLLGALGQLLPAIFFTANDNDDTIAIKWLGALRAETTIATTLRAENP